MASSRLKIMVVDDNELNLKLFHDLLERVHSCDVRCYFTGEFALQNFERGQYDFIILDIMLPDIDGYNLFKAVRAIDEEVPIAASTACAIKGDEDALYEFGFDFVIGKPVSLKQVAEVISELR